MANIEEPTEEMRASYQQWVATRPECVRVVAERFEPWALYRMKSTGQRVVILSFGEAEDDTVTLTVYISGEFNLTLFNRQVFGIKPDDLEPCDLPPKDEPVGVLMTPQQVDDNIDILRSIATADRKRTH
jgi:hypothetical protein